MQIYGVAGVLDGIAWSADHEPGVRWCADCREAGRWVPFIAASHRHDHSCRQYTSQDDWAAQQAIVRPRRRVRQGLGRVAC